MRQQLMTELWETQGEPPVNDIFLSFLFFLHENGHICIQPTFSLEESIVPHLINSRLSKILKACMDLDVWKGSLNLITHPPNYSRSTWNSFSILSKKACLGYSISNSHWHEFMVPGTFCIESHDFIMPCLTPISVYILFNKISKYLVKYWEYAYTVAFFHTLCQIIPIHMKSVIFIIYRWQKYLVRGVRLAPLLRISNLIHIVPNLQV